MNASLLAALQMGGGQMGSGMGPGGWGPGFAVVGIAVMLLVLATVAYLLTRAFGGGDGRRTGGRRETAVGGRSTSGEDQALAELRERYARGEIDDEEFEQRAQRLRGTHDSSE